jgi:hypothetical protein
LVPSIDSVFFEKKFDTLAPSLAKILKIVASELEISLKTMDNKRNLLQVIQSHLHRRNFLEKFIDPSSEEEESGQRILEKFEQVRKKFFSSFLNNFQVDERRSKKKRGTIFPSECDHGDG